MFSSLSLSRSLNLYLSLSHAHILSYWLVFAHVDRCVTEKEKEKNALRHNRSVFYLWIDLLFSLFNIRYDVCVWNGWIFMAEHKNTRIEQHFYISVNKFIIGNVAHQIKECVDWTHLICENVIRNILCACLAAIRRSHMTKWWS